MPIFNENELVRGKPYIQDREIWPQETRRMFHGMVQSTCKLVSRYDILIDIVNRYGVTHKCNTQTDGQTLS